MGLLANTVSFRQYQVLGELPTGDPAEWAARQLAGHAFSPIDQSAEELSVGWVALDDPQDHEFCAPQMFYRPPYLTFSLRRDQRRVPAALLRYHLDQAEAQFLAAHPSFKRVPKDKREELRDRVKSALLARTLPAPSVFDAVWNLEQGVLSFTATSTQVAELFEDLFRKTFEGLRLVVLHPYARAQALLPEALQSALAQANRASTEAVLEQIQENTWLGREFLRRLLALNLSGRSTFQVGCAGPAVEGEKFSAFLDNRLVLADNLQRITVAGPQDQFAEARTALLSGKELADAGIVIEKGEDAWRTTLNGELFLFRSFKSPGVKLEKDEITDAQSERIAIFYERMHVLAEGLQLFDSLLLDYLKERLTENWPQRCQELESFIG